MGANLGLAKHDALFDEFVRDHLMPGEDTVLFADAYRTYQRCILGSSIREPGAMASSKGVLDMQQAVARISNHVMVCQS